MPRWHWVYRDLVAEVREASEEDWIQSCHEYVKQNWSLLNQIHFQAKGFESLGQVLDRFRTLGWGNYSGLFRNLYDLSAFESTIVSMTDALLKRLEHKAEGQEVYVIVGLNCTNIYSTDYEGCPVTVLCLETTDGILEEIELLLAHEAHHWKRQRIVSHNIFDHSVQERCVTEGLAACFSEEVQPGRPIHEYCFVPPETVAWVKSHIAEMEEILQENHNTPMSALFSRDPDIAPIPGMPPRTGYVYGYFLAKAFLERVKKTSVQMAGVDCDIVFKEAGVKSDPIPKL